MKFALTVTFEKRRLRQIFRL